MEFTKIKTSYAPLAVSQLVSGGAIFPPPGSLFPFTVFFRESTACFSQRLRTRTHFLRKGSGSLNTWRFDF